MAIRQPRETGGDARPDAELTHEQREWAVHSELLWRKARAIAASNPELDPGDIYHALRALERAPSERLRAALQRGRLRAHSR